MKRIKLLLFAGLVVSCLKISAQTIPGSFKIINNHLPDKEAFYAASIEKANMEQFRLKDENVELSFTNGFTLVLLSAKEVFIKQGKIDPNNYSVSHPTNYTPRVFFIRPDGWLTTTGSDISESKVKPAH